MKKFDPSIDPDRLEAEVLHHSEMFYEWAAMLAEARAEVLQCKDDLTYIQAKTAKRLREESVGRITEDMIKEGVAVAFDVTDAKTRLRSAQLRQDKIQAAVDTLHQRKVNLQDAVRLFLSNFFSDPETTGLDATEIRSKLNKRQWHREQADDAWDEEA